MLLQLFRTAVSAALLSVVVSFLEMVTISSTGIIGCVMNILSTWGFACVATLIYKRVHTLKGAIIGLAAGCLTATALMLLWNYLITPLYMGLAREAVVEMLLPIFLPYNLLKCAMNAALTMLIYKPLVTALRRGVFTEKVETFTNRNTVNSIVEFLPVSRNVDSCKYSL